MHRHLRVGSIASGVPVFNQTIPAMPSPTPASTITSPCVRNCCLDENDVCLGCGRELQEILRWQQSTSAEREIILSTSRQRLALRRERRGY